MAAGQRQIPLSQPLLQFIPITLGVAVCGEIMSITNRAFVNLHMNTIR